MSGPVGELSVEYNEHFGQWIALHLDEERAAIVLRWAPELTGPWAAGQVVAEAKDYPELYGGYLHPWAKRWFLGVLHVVAVGSVQRGACCAPTSAENQLRASHARLESHRLREKRGDVAWTSLSFARAHSPVLLLKGLPPLTSPDLQTLGWDDKFRRRVAR